MDINRDLKIDRFTLLRAVQPGQQCIQCGKLLKVSRAIEVGHIFKLGTRYSEALGANFLDENGSSKPIIMGSYGIGIERIMACAVETYFNDSSMVWPREITPFLVEILPLNMTHKQSADIASNLYNTLNQEGISVLLDDRDDRAGVKFKDADLFGSPIYVVIGERNLKEGCVELRVRDRDSIEKVEVDSIESRVLEAIGK